MKIKSLIVAAASALMIAGSASAASLSIVGGKDVALPSNYNPQPNQVVAPGVNIGTVIKVFGNSPEGELFNGSNGLMLSHSRKLVYEYLGSQANHINEAIELIMGSSLNNKLSNVGDTIEAKDDGGIVDFMYKTTRPATLAVRKITNGIGHSGAAGSQFLSIGFYQEKDDSVLAFFGDGQKDNDHDDMIVRISIVPLPAGGLLLLTALGGFAAMRRRKTA